MFSDLARNRPLVLGWSQFSLLCFGVIALIVSLPPVRRGLRALLARSLALSPATRLQLESRPLLYVLYSLWFALVFGFGEASFWTYKKLFVDKVLPSARILFPGYNYLWGIPLGYALIFVCLGMASFVLARQWARQVTLSRVLVVFLFCGLLGWLNLFTSLHIVTVVILAGGLTLQLARATTRHHYIFHRLVQRTFLVLVLLGAVVATGLWASLRITEARRIAGLPEPAAQAPNVLLIVLDTVRARSLSLYGYQRATTPHLDELATRGVVFDRALSTSPWTLPSHGTMFTGQFPHDLTADWTTPIDATHPTLAEVLGRHGYLTAGFAANTAYLTGQYGLNRGFIHYESLTISIPRAFQSTSLGTLLLNKLGLNKDSYHRPSAEQINQEFLRWLEGRSKEHPYFAFLNFFDTHDPYLPPADFAQKFSSKEDRRQIKAKPLDEWTEPEIREFNNSYDATLAYLDHEIGVLFEALEQRGELEHTLVIITSDHGEQFGEHGLLVHADSLYMPLLHVPLIVIFPGQIPAGRRIDAFVSLRDLAATVTQVAGVADNIRFPGESLARFWTPGADLNPPPDGVLLAEIKRAQPAVPDNYPARKGAMGSVIYKGMHYIKNYGDGREELYNLIPNLRDDVDLSTTEGQQLEIFRSQLEHMTKEAGN